MTGGRGHTALARRGVLRDHTAERKAGETYVVPDRKADALERIATALETLAARPTFAAQTWREP